MKRKSANKEKEILDNADGCRQAFTGLHGALGGNSCSCWGAMGSDCVWVGDGCLLVLCVTLH